MVGIVAQQAQRRRPDRKMSALNHFETDPTRSENGAELAVRKQRDIAFHRPDMSNQPIGAP